MGFDTFFSVRGRYREWVPNACEQSVELRNVLRHNGLQLQAKALTREDMADQSFYANLAFLHQKVEEQAITLGLAESCFQKEPGRA